MPTTSTINLLHTKTDGSANFRSLESHLSRVSFWVVTIVVLGGLVTGGAFFFLKGQRVVIGRQKEQLVNLITAQSQKEGLYLSIKERAKIVEQVAASKRPWAETVDLVAAFAPVETIRSLVVDEEKSQVSLSMTLPSFDSMLPMVDSLKELVLSGKVRQLQLASFAFGKDGAVDIALTFTPIF